MCTCIESTWRRHQEFRRWVLLELRHVYRFTPMSVELYREKVRHRVTGQPDFETTEALRRHYRALPA